MKQTGSIFNRFITKRRPIWATLLISIVLLLPPIGAAYLDGALDEVIHSGQWRVFLMAPVIIIYILIVGPLMTSMGDEVIRSLRPLVPMDDDDYKHLVDQSAHIKSRNEWVAFGIGFAAGIFVSMASGLDSSMTWLSIYWYVYTGLMYGLLAWTFYAAAASTRVNNAIHEQPLRFDILDPSTFEAVGRQSMLLALVFVGGITLGLIFSFQPESLSSPQFWIIYLLLVLVILLIFFLNMRPTHKVLDAEKKRRLDPVQKRVRQAYPDLLNHLDQGDYSQNIPSTIIALEYYEKRLKAARTWPYDTAMLRTLFFSVLIPIGTLLIRVGFELLFR